MVTHEELLSILTDIDFPIYGDPSFLNLDSIASRVVFELEQDEIYLSLDKARQATDNAIDRRISEIVSENLERLNRDSPAEEIVSVGRKSAY